MSQQFEPFGKHILLEKLATGGMAEVYLAKNNGADGIGKLVAIKRILPQYSESPEFIDMFKDEAKIAVNLAHSNIVSIHEFGVEREQFFLVMDYVEGRNLRQILNKMKKSGLSFSVEQVLYVVKEVAAGLDSAHRCLDRSSGKPLNITHRDMSPQNVMISFEGEVKVVDFGIAKAETQIETTRAGTLKGKFGYMSPEQAEGQVVDLRTDIFSLGIVLWELLANDRLFVANNEINTLRKIRDCQIPSLRKINPNIPAELERICNKALARDRNLRYQTAAAFHRELSRFLNRQYPDFSPHDFSVFIKTLFAGEILDHRKKIVDYSRVDASGNVAPSPSSAASPPPAPANAGATAQSTRPAETTRTEYEPPATTERTQHTDSNSSLGAKYLNKPTPAPKEKAATTQPQAAPEPPAKPAEAKKSAATKKQKSGATKKKDPLSASLEFDKLRVDSSNRAGGLRLDTGVREGSFANGTATGYRHGGRGYGYTTTNSRIESGLKARLSPATAAGLIAVAAIAFLAYRPELARNLTRFGKAGDASLSSVQEPPPNPGARMITISVTSTPPSAEVWIDGVAQKDVTPLMLQVEADREYQITIRREQYADWNVKRRFTRNGEKLAPKLFVSRVAFIDVLVEGNGEIYINNERRALGGPLLGVQIAANEDVTVRAYDPQTGAEAAERIRLGEGFRRVVKLYPKILPKAGGELGFPSGRDPSQSSPPRRNR